MFKKLFLFMTAFSVIFLMSVINPPGGTDNAIKRNKSSGQDLTADFNINGVDEAANFTGYMNFQVTPNEVTGLNNESTLQAARDGTINNISLNNENSENLTSHYMFGRAPLASNMFSNEFVKGITEELTKSRENGEVDVGSNYSNVIMNSGLQQNLTNGLTGSYNTSGTGLIDVDVGQCNVVPFNNDFTVQRLTYQVSFSPGVVQIESGDWDKKTEVETKFAICEIVEETVNWTGSVNKIITQAAATNLNNYNNSANKSNQEKIVLI